VSSRFQTLDKLPLFAREEQISAAILGPGKYVEWQQIVPLLERRGFPIVDGLHGGRYTPAVKAFYDQQYLSDDGRTPSAPHQPAKIGSYSGRQKARPGT
jgi:hypothetical protein